MRAMRTEVKLISLSLTVAFAAPALPGPAGTSETSNRPHEQMAARIAAALALEKGETVLVGTAGGGTVLVRDGSLQHF